MADDEQSILGDIYDAGRNIFSRVLDIEVEAYEARRLAKARAAEQAAADARQSRFLEQPYTQQQKAVIGISSTLSIAMLLAAFVLMMRRK